MLNNPICGVLVIEDEPLVLKYIASLLAGLGYRKVYKAKTAQEARALLLTESISIIISDVSLPDGDGREIVSGALQNNADLSAVLVSGFHRGELELPGSLCGRVELLQKPFNEEALAEALRALANCRFSELSV